MLFCLHKQTTSFKKIVNEKTLIDLNCQIKEKKLARGMLFLIYLVKLT